MTDEQKYFPLESCQAQFEKKNQYCFLEKEKFSKKGEEPRYSYRITITSLVEKSIPQVGFSKPSEDIKTKGLPTLGIHDYSNLTNLKDKERYKLFSGEVFQIEEETFDKLIFNYHLAPFSKEDFESSKIKELSYIFHPDYTIYTYEDLK